MAKVVVFGSLPIASRIVDFLLNMQVEVVAVVGSQNPHNNDPWPNVPLLVDFCRQKGVEVIDLMDLTVRFCEGSFDLGLSCRFSRIIKDPVIRLFRNGIINMHGGILPEFGGLYSVNHEMLKGVREAGGTLHYIDVGMDTGDIIKWCNFSVAENDTGFSVFQKTQLALESGMKEILPIALNGRIVGIPQKRLIEEGRKKGYYDKHSLDGLKEIAIGDLGSEQADRTIRAFDFPGYEPAYFVNRVGRKIYLRVSS